MHAHTVVEERQRVQEEAAALLLAEDCGQLRDDGLRFRAQLAAEHKNNVARRLADELARKSDLVGAHT